MALFPKPASGEVTVYGPDGCLKTFGDESRHSLYDASYVGGGLGYGAFPRTDEFTLTPPATNQGLRRQMGDD